jgi:hypothetical protein
MMNSVLHDESLRVGPAGGEIDLRLRHYQGERDQPDVCQRRCDRAVLLLHGGNTSSETFLLPEGGLARYLRENGCDVWLLDWRSSPHVLGRVLNRPPLGGSEGAERAIYTLVSVAQEDIPRAVARVRESIAPGLDLSLLGHCLGGGTISMAVARRTVPGVRNIVLSTLGLFYEVPWSGWLKAEDFLLERAIAKPGHRSIDPHDHGRWPEPFQLAYEKWPRAWLPRGGSREEVMLQRLTFMFGQPYASSALHPSIHGGLLSSQFGPMHIGLYIHAGQLVRRGYAASFDAPDVLDRRPEPRHTKRGAVSAAPRGGNAPEGDLTPEPFVPLNVTIIGAAENQLWHRDAADRMYEWVRNHQSAAGRKSCRKVMFARYRIQELLWGKDARRAVYPAYLDGVCGKV